MKAQWAPVRTIALHLAVAAILIGAALPASGAQHRVLLEWSGESQGNSAMAQGFMVIDDAVLNNPGATEFPAAPFVKDFQIVVSKASNRADNTIFNAADFGGISLTFAGGGGELDRELVGQNEFLGLSLAGENPSAPISVSANTIRTGGGTGEILVLTSFRPLVSTSVRVYKCTFSAKGIYNYGNEGPAGGGVEEWVSRSYSARAAYYMVLDPGSKLLSFIWVDTKLRQFQRLIDCALPELNYFQNRAPSTKNPAGDWELGIPLWSHREDIDIDPSSGTTDACRSRSLYLTGPEKLTTFLLPDSRTSLRDLCASSLSGSFCQVTDYDDCHYAFGDSRKGASLSWEDPAREGGGFACVTGTLSCKLDTKFTATAIENGGGLADGENAVVDYLLGSGYTAHADIDSAGDSLSLQPTGGEVLEILIP